MGYFQPMRSAHNHSRTKRPEFIGGATEKSVSNAYLSQLDART